MARCPNINSREWKFAVDKLGEDEAWALFAANDRNVPNEEVVQMYLLDNRLKQFLGTNGIKIQAYNDMLTRFGGDVKAAADVVNQAILTADGKVETTVLAEETAHFAIEMLGDDNAIVKRMMNTIEQFPEYNNVVDDYSKTYNNDETKLKKEAVGKVLAKYILQRSEDPISPSRKNLLQRIWDAAMRVFKRINPAQFKNSVEDIYKQTAEDIIKNDLKEADIDNLKESKIDVLFSKNADRALSREEKILDNIISTEVKRLKIFYSRANEKFSEKEKNLIKDLSNDLENHQATRGILKYLKNAKSEFNKIDERLIELKNEVKDIDSANLMPVIKSYRDMRNYIKAFEPILSELEAEISADDQLNAQAKAKYKKFLRELSGTVKDANNDYYEAGIPLVTKFLSPFIGNRGAVPFGKKKGESFDISEALQTSKGDISFMDRMLQSMADSKDDILGLIDIAVKKSKFEADRATLDISKDILQAKIDLEKAGFKSDEFMYETDAKGKKTGYYINKHNLGEFEAERKAFFDKMGEKPADTRAAKAWDKQVAEWFSKNTVKDEESFRGYSPSDKYLNPKYKELSNAQLEYHKKFIDTLFQLKKRIPMKYRDPNKVIMLRKNTVERLKGAAKKNGIKGIKELVAEGFIRKEDEDQFGQSFKITNFDGKEASFLPIYYHNEIKDTDDISTDTVFTLSSYASMANDFGEMNKIVDALELAKDVVGNRRSEIIEGGKAKKESFTTIAGKFSKSISKKGDETNTYKRLEDYYNMVVYGKIKKEEGTINVFGTEIDKAKTLDLLGRYTSINSLALNVYAGVANINLGKAMLRTEAFAQEHVKYKDLLSADKIYGKELMDPTNGVVTNLGKRNSTNKLDLWQEHFDVMQDQRTNIRSLDTKSKTRFGQSFKLGSLFFINKCGEHYIQNRMSLALANRIKLKDASGKDINLWEAYEVKGNKLKLKEGITKEDGSKWTKDDEFKFRNKTSFVNNRLHGIYNDIDKSAIQQYALGRLGIMYRKYLVPGINRRFQELKFNYQGDVWTEGYYRTTGRFMKGLISDMKQMQFNIVTHWNELTDVEKANMRRTMADVAYLIGTATLAAILTNISGDEDDDWHLNMMAYQTNRLFTEIGALTPSPLLISEGFRIVKSPMAAVTTLQDIVNFMEFWNWTDTIEHGKYKGQSKFYRSGLKLVKPLKGLEDLANPEQKLKFFN